VSSAPRHLSARDRYIGWTPEARRRNLRFLAYNPRFLVLPWVQVKHLASHILGQMLAGWWATGNGSIITRSIFWRLSLTPRSTAHVYRAANWVVMDGRQAGETLP